MVASGTGRKSRSMPGPCVQKLTPSKEAAARAAFLTYAVGKLISSEERVASRVNDGNAAILRITEFGK